MDYLIGVVDDTHPLWPAVRRATLGQPLQLGVRVVPGYFTWERKVEEETVAVAFNGSSPLMHVFMPHIREVLAHYGAYGLLLWTEEVVKHELMHFLHDTDDHTSEEWQSVAELGVVARATGNATHFERIKSMEEFYVEDLGITVPYDAHQLATFYSQADARRCRGRWKGI